MTSGVLPLVILAMSTIAAVGSVIRVVQNERSYRLMVRMYKKRKKKK